MKQRNMLSKCTTEYRKFYSTNNPISSTSKLGRGGMRRGTYKLEGVYKGWKILLFPIFAALCCGRIILSLFLLTSALAMWFALTNEMWADVMVATSEWKLLLFFFSFPRSFKSHCMFQAFLLSICQEVGVSQIGTLSSVQGQEWRGCEADSQWKSAWAGNKP